jgi:uncharacterized repeat protein (TIGR01451 family)
MKKHVMWLLFVALILTTAVAVAANEPAENATTFAVGDFSPNYSGTGGGCTIGTWTTVASLNTARSRPTTAFYPPNGNFYTLAGEATGGNRDIPIEEYDPVADTWTDRANLLTGVSNTGSATVGSYIYVPGGWTGAASTNTMQRYDPVANSVATMATLPAGNAAHAVVALGTDVYVLAGSGTGGVGSTNYIYDTVADSWSTGAAVPVGTNYPSATTDGAYVYLIGGGTTGADINNVQRYDPVADSWSALTGMISARGGPGAFFDGQNIWAVAGGWTGYFTTTEYWDGVAWNAGPAVSTGVRTLGTAFGDGLGVKAGGWAGAYVGTTEAIDIVCAPPAAPGIAVDKSPASQNVTTNGIADFTITVTNTGDVDLANVSVSDPLVPACDNAIGTLVVSGTISYGCQDTNVTGSYTNVVTVTGAYTVGQITVTDTASALVVYTSPTSVDLNGFSGNAEMSILPFVTLLVVLAGIGAIIYRKRIA